MLNIVESLTKIRTSQIFDCSFSDSLVNKTANKEFLTLGIFDSVIDFGVETLM